jgi:hypothetical protein
LITIKEQVEDNPSARFITTQNDEDCQEKESGSRQFISKSIIEDIE